MDEDAIKLLSLEQKSRSTDKRIKLMPDDTLNILSKIDRKDQALMGIPSPQNMIIEVLAVGPPQIRPSVIMPGSG